MKATKLLFMSVMLAVFSMLGTSCLPDTEYGPDPVEGSIIRFRISNSPEAVVAMSGKNIAITLPIGSTLTGLIPEIIVSKGTTILDYTVGQEMDFSNDVIVKVKGTDDVIIEYLVKAEVKEPQPGFISAELFFERKHIDYGWPQHYTTSIAVSKENFLVVLSTLREIQKFDANTGERTGTMAWPGEGIPMQQIANDSQGKILGITQSSGGTVAKIFKWDNVNSQPEEFLSWNLDLAGANVVGRGSLSVNGDITKNAVIYTPACGHAYVLRWTIKDGVLLSQDPEKVPYIPPVVGNGLLPHITPSVNALGPNPEDGFTMSAYNRGTSYVGPTHEYVLQPSAYQGNTSAQGAARSFVFDFNRAKYMVGALYGSTISIFDITKPEGIEMNEEQRFENGIEFKPFTSPSFPSNAGVANVSPYISFSIKQNDDGTAILYYLFANSGIRAYKLTPKQ